MVPLSMILLSTHQRIPFEGLLRLRRQARAANIPCSLFHCAAAHRQRRRCTNQDVCGVCEVNLTDHQRLQALNKINHISDTDSLCAKAIYDNPFRLDFDAAVAWLARNRIATAGGLHRSYRAVAYLIALRPAATFGRSDAAAHGWRVTTDEHGTRLAAEHLRRWT